MYNDLDSRVREDCRELRRQHRSTADDSQSMHSQDTFLPSRESLPQSEQFRPRITPDTHQWRSDQCIVQALHKAQIEQTLDSNESSQAASWCQCSSCMFWARLNEHHPSDNPRSWPFEPLITSAYRPIILSVTAMASKISERLSRGLQTAWDVYQLGDCLPADKAQALMKALDYFEAQHSDKSSRRSARLSPGKGRPFQR